MATTYKLTFHETGNTILFDFIDHTYVDQSCLYTVGTDEYMKLSEQTNKSMVFRAFKEFLHADELLCEEPNNPERKSKRATCWKTVKNYIDNCGDKSVSVEPVDDKS